MPDSKRTSRLLNSVQLCSDTNKSKNLCQVLQGGKNKPENTGINEAKCSPVDNMQMLENSERTDLHPRKKIMNIFWRICTLTENLMDRQNSIDEETKAYLLVWKRLFGFTQN